MVTHSRRFGPRNWFMTRVMDKFTRVQRGVPDVPANRRQREAFMKAYLDALRAVPNVKEVSVKDRVSYLDVCTIYTGDIRDFEDAIYEAEGRAIDKFPDVRVRWNLVHESQRVSSDSVD